MGRNKSLRKGVKKPESRIYGASDPDYAAFGITGADCVDFTVRGCDAGLMPEGGLVAYPVMERRGASYMTEYEKWCEDTRTDRGDLRYGVRFRIDGARVCEVNSWADFINLIREYPLLKTEGNSVVGIGIDYGRMAGDYDAVCLTARGLWNTERTEDRILDISRGVVRLSPEQRSYDINGPVEINAYGWVVPCICVFRASAVRDAVRFENSRRYILCEQETMDEIIKFIGRIDDAEIRDGIEGYYKGDVPFGDLVRTVRRYAENDRKYGDLMDRIRDLIQLQRQMDRGDCGIDITDAIEGSVRNLYRLTEKTGLDTAKYGRFRDHVLGALNPGCFRAHDGGKSVSDIVMDYFG